MTDVKTIDCGYMGEKEMAAVYLIQDGDELAFIDNNTNAALPKLLDAVEAAGRTPEDVKYIIITHVHLDHAGGTSALASACANATVLAHPRAARHVIDPSRLVESAKAVYGAEEFERLYGTIVGVDASRVREMEDESSAELGAGTLRFLHTRGHANHHFVVWDETSKSLFSGDAFGLTYPCLQGPGPFTFPSSSPTDFDAELARQAVDRIERLSPARVYPTHFGAVTDVATAAAQMRRHLDFYESVMEDAFASEHPDEALTAYCAQRLRDYFAGLLNQQGGLGADPATWQWLTLDLELNAQGLAFAATKKRKKS